MNQLEQLRQEHAFCAQCGNEMIYDVKSDPSTFDRRTGKEIKGRQYHYWLCPMWSEKTPYDAPHLGPQHDRVDLSKTSHLGYFMSSLWKQKGYTT